MWVMTSKGVGIIVGIQDELFVHLVNSKGETIAQELFPFSETRQANVNEIPEPRRPTREVAERLGY